MKKTIPITISNILFHIEEDGYEKLSRYLESLQKHFAHLPEKDEVISDIESRIAEQFLSGKHSKDKIVSLTMVNELISSMGEIKDLDEESVSTENARPEQGQKRLFRNPDDVVIAGVASGLAAYLTLDVVWVRLIMALLALANGFGILLYIILWIAMPIAHTASEKLEMRGSKVTIEGMRELAQEKRSRADHARTWLHKLFTPIQIIIQFIKKVITTVIPLITRIIGFFIMMGSIITLTFFSAGLFTILFNLNSRFIDPPFIALFESAPNILLYASICVGFIVIGIPLAFLFLIGLSLLTLKRKGSATLAFTLLGIWCIALIAGFTMLPKWMDRWQTIEAAREQSNQFITRTIDIQDFVNIHLNSRANAKITQGDKFRITLEGNQNDLDETNVLKNGDTLVIERKNKNDFCILCWSDRKDINMIIEMPSLSRLELKNGSEVEVTGFDSETFDANILFGSSLAWNGSADTFTLELENGAYAKLSGTSTTMNISTLHGSTVNALDLVAETGTIVLKNHSEGRVNITSSISGDVANASTLYYLGEPQLKITERNASSIQKIGQERLLFDRDPFEDGFDF